MNLNQVTVPSLDLSISVPFYKKLGLKIIVDAPPHYARFECPNGESTFSIHKTEELPVGTCIYVYFECENLDERVEYLLKKEFYLTNILQINGGCDRKQDYKGPDGNQLI